MPRVKTSMKDQLNEVDCLVGQRIKFRRIEMHKSQEDLGKHCNVTFQQVQKYENGKNRVSASRLQQISECLGVEPSYFFGNGKSHVEPSMGSVAPDNLATKMLIAFTKIKKREVRIALKDLAVALS